ncbi:EscU/YscU/HrcU family type III secretion system export apparatus switch protein [Buchnera aphidicola]|uniref:EscU/YscU/HrcU family type III secretion system export apparatus switch protein n=1 Tax=Buchnera aphidicola TaxID=9 RepID=UPI0022B7AC58|nr:EscU/YscU/HrcU family type III secretion system export apparatus switch protein [Buchnera aphidicola]
MEFFSTLLKIIIIIFMSLYYIWDNFSKINQFYSYSLLNSIFYGFYFLFKFTRILMIFVFFIAIIDAILQYFQYLNNLRMTIQEVKDEYKELEGNPLIKQKMRSLTQQLSKKYSIFDLKKSDVIIFNSINCAVAIQYEIKSMSSPTVLFKGVGYLSAKIIKIAKKNNIPIFISNSLAIYLYNNSSIGSYIPSNLYISIAKILSWAWQLKYWKKYGGTYPVKPIIFFDN